MTDKPMKAGVMCTETDFIPMRSVFNGGSGHIISGSRNSANSARFISISTDRNGKDGCLVTQTGPFPVAIGTLSCNRDGAASTIADYAGLAVVGVDTTNRTAHLTGHWTAGSFSDFSPQVGLLRD